MPIGVKVDGNADVDGDTTAFRGDSSPIQPGQTGGNRGRAFSGSTYDDLDRVAAVDGAKTYPLFYEYDLNGRMTALIDGEGSRTEWAYDSLGRLTQKTYNSYGNSYGDVRAEELPVEGVPAASWR